MQQQHFSEQPKSEVSFKLKYKKKLTSQVELFLTDVICTSYSVKFAKKIITNLTHILLMYSVFYEI